MVPRIGQPSSVIAITKVFNPMSDVFVGLQPNTPVTTGATPVLVKVASGILVETFVVIETLSPLASEIENWNDAVSPKQISMAFGPIFVPVITVPIESVVG